MEKIVTGCKDCPLYDTTGDEYGVYCHHPSGAVQVGTWDNGEFTELPMSEDEKRNFLLRFYAQDERVFEGLWVENLAIDDDSEYKPITPDWCPLKTDSITIKLKS